MATNGNTNGLPNADADAFPQECDGYHYSGLSKREYAAIHLAAAYIAKGFNASDAMLCGVDAAKILFAELEKDKRP